MLSLGSKNHKYNKTSYKIENESIAPSKEYYLPIGYIPKLKRNLDNNNYIHEVKENNEYKISNITKYYRRYNKIIKKYNSTNDNNSLNKDDNKNMDKIPKNLFDRGYGKFKVVIRIYEKEKMEKFPLAIERFRVTDEKIIKNVEKYEKLTESILVKHELLIRVYILELRYLPKRDLLSDSDPYIKIYFGEEKKSDEVNYYQKNKKNVV